MKAQQTRAFRTAGHAHAAESAVESHCLRRHVAVSITNTVSALAVLHSLIGANIICVKSHGAEHEIVVDFPNREALSTFTAQYTEEQ